MPYIGHSPTNAGTFYILDALTMSSSTNYTMQVGGVDVTPNVDNLLITLDGVIQHPSTAYTVSGSTLTFDTAPGTGVEFYGVVMGQSASTGQGSIGADELKVTGDGTANQILSSDADGTMTWKDGTLSTTSATGDVIYRNASGVLAKLAIGTTGQLLTVASGLPSWATDSEPYLPLAGGTMSGAINLGSQNVTNGGTITGTFVGGITGNVTGNTSGSSGSTTGNAATATTLATARNINGVSFNGSSAITVTADANTLSNTTLKSTVVSSSLESVGTLTGLSVDGGTSSLNRGNSSGDILDVRGQNASQMKVTTTAFTVTPNATFAGDIRSVGTGVRTIRLESTTNAQNLNLDFFNNANAIAGRITYQEGAGAFYFQPNQAGGDTALTLDWSNNATFAGSISGTDLTLNSGSPLRFTSQGTGTYNRTVMYHGQNSTSGNDTNGVMWEMGRLTDSSSAEIRKFAIGDRGGGIHWIVDGTGNTIQDGGATFGGNVTFNGVNESDADFQMGFGTATLKSDRRITLTEQNSVAAAISMTDTDQAEYGIVGMARDTNSLLAGSGNVNLVIANTWDNANSKIIFGTRAVLRLTIAGDGTLTGSATNDISDRELKKNIKSITNGLDTIKQLQGRTFEWKKSADMQEGVKYGLIAQELEEVLPDLVYDKDGIRAKSQAVLDEDKNVIEEGVYYKSITMNGVIPVLIEAVKELSSKLDTANDKITALENA